MRGKVWLLACLVAAGCPCGGSLTQRPFACQADLDCADGWGCVEGACTLGAKDGGAADAGVVPDAGGADGGASDAGSDAGDPCGPAAGPLADSGEVAAYCALHRTVVIDGLLDDWSGIPFTPLTRQSAQRALGAWTGNPALDDPDLSGSFALQWDAQYLYVAASVTDDIRSLHPSASGYYADDAVEVFWNGSGQRAVGYDAGDRQICIRADNAGEQFSGADNGTLLISLPPGVLTATLDAGTAANWAVEVAIPWDQLGTSMPLPGKAIGFDLILDDDDSDAGTQVRKHYLIWAENDSGVAGCPEPHCSTAAFGLAVLTGAPP